jgi:excisionase family DNA binding protein
MQIHNKENSIKPAMYKPQDVARIMDCSDVHIRNLCNKGEIPHIKLGKEYRIPIKFIEDKLNEVQAS